LGSGSNYRKLADLEHLIDYKYVYEVKYENGDANYTFGFNDPKATDTIFYNIVMKKRDGYAKTVLIRYEMDKVFAGAFLGGEADFKNFTGTIEVELLDADEGIDCEEEPSIIIPVTGGNGPGSGGPGGSGGSGSGGSGGGGGGSGGNPYNQSVVDAKYLQLTIGAPVVAEDPNGDDSDNGEEKEDTGFLGGIFWGLRHKSPRNLRTGGIDPTLVDPTDPCAGQEEIGIIEPVPDPHEKNCEELKKMTEILAIKNSFTELLTHTGEGREYGYLFKDNANPSHLVLAPNSEQMLVVPTGEGIWGASHTHPTPNGNDDDWYAPMFSLTDIYKLGEIAYNYRPSVGFRRNIHKYTFTLTVEPGSENPSDQKQTYALKINDWEKFGQFVLQYSALSDDEKKSKGFILQKKYNTTHKNGDGIENFIKDMFNFIKEQNIEGISLYKAKPNFTGWNRVDYNSTTNQFTYLPCEN